jgi:hypothetical protein
MRGGGAVRYDCSEDHDMTDVIVERHENASRIWNYDERKLQRFFVLHWQVCICVLLFELEVERPDSSHPRTS